MNLPGLSSLSDRIADAIAGELRRQHAAIIAERDDARAALAVAETALAASRAAVLDLEAAIAGMSRSMAARDAEVARLATPTPPPAPTCAICERPLTGTPREAEMSTDGTWHPVGKVPASLTSQGVFDLGSDCYARHVATDRPTMADLLDRRRDEEIATIAKNRAARAVGEAGKGKTKADRNAIATIANRAAKADRNADRVAVLREAARITCPTCEAPAGKPCHEDDDDGGREVSPHPDRLGAARKRLADARARLDVPCPTCSAPAGTPCVVDGRRGLHTDRRAP